MKRTILTILCVLGMTAAASADIQVVANFDDGNTETEADGFLGMAGDGWSDRWRLPGWNDLNASTNGSIAGTVLTSGDTGFSEVTSGGGNYLNINMEGPGTAGIARDFDASAMDANKPYTIQFSYRADDGITESFNSSNDRIQFFNSPDLRSTSDASCSWIIGAYGGSTSWVDAEDVGYWLFYDGQNDGGGFNNTLQVNTGIALTEGVTYDFSILVDPVNCNYIPTITDTDSGTSYTPSSSLGFRTAATSMPMRMEFGSILSSTGDFLDYSLDNVMISQETAEVPEPSTIVGLIALLMAGLVIKRRR